MDNLYEIQKTYGYIAKKNEKGELRAYCIECGRSVGQHIKGYGWIFSSCVDFGDEEKGLCDECKEKK